MQSLFIFLIGGAASTALVLSGIWAAGQVSDWVVRRWDQ